MLSLEFGSMLSIMEFMGSVFDIELFWETVVDGDITIVGDVEEESEEHEDDEDDTEEPSQDRQDS